MGGRGWGSGLKLSLSQILEESDIDRDGTINLSEFQHVISRSPDFARYDSGAPAFWVPAGPNLLPLGLGHCYRRWCQGERKPQSTHTGPAKLAVSPRAGAALLVKASPLPTAIVIALFVLISNKGLEALTLCGGSESSLWMSQGVLPEWADTRDTVRSKEGSKGRRGVKFGFSPYPPLPAENPPLFPCSAPLRLSCDSSPSVCPGTLSKNLSTAELWPRSSLCCQRRPRWPSLELALCSLTPGRGSPPCQGLSSLPLSLLRLCLY